MSHRTLVPAKPQHITLDTLPQLFAHWRAQAGGLSMTATPPENDPPAPPERPEGVSEEEWKALSDPGRTALVRERDARAAAERALAAARARPAPPKPQDPPKSDPSKVDPPKVGEGTDVAALIQQAVAAAVKPFVEERQQARAEEAAGKVRDAVLEAAKSRLHDSTDALSNIDLTKVVNDQGEADAEKVKTELDDLVKRKPHLAKAPERFAPAGIGGGGPASATDAERVKAVLADMQRATGVRVPSSTTN